MIEMSLMECAAHCLLAIGVAGALALILRGQQGGRGGA